MMKQRRFFKHKKPLNIFLRKFDGIFSVKGARLEIRYFRFFKNFFSTRWKIKNQKFNIRHIYFYLKPRFFLRQKSTNSRMGSGTGKFIRLSKIVKPGHPIILCKNCYSKELKYYCNFIKKKLNIHFVWKFCKYQLLFFKIIFFIFFGVISRSVLPRYRVDQFIVLCWKFLLFFQFIFLFIFLLMI